MFVSWPATCTYRYAQVLRFAGSRPNYYGGTYRSDNSSSNEDDSDHYQNQIWLANIE